MARITKYTTQLGLQSPPLPDIRVDQSLSRAIQGFGGAVSSLAGSIQAEQEKARARKEQQEDFEATDRYRAWNTALGEELTEQATNMEPGGTGFHDRFMDNYRQKRDAFLQSIPERLRDRYSHITALPGEDGLGGSAYENWSVKAATTERDERYRYAGARADEIQSEALGTISMDPDAFDDMLQSGNEFIDALPIPTTLKEARKKAFRSAAQDAYIEGHLDINGPAKVAQLLNPFQITSRDVRIPMTKGGTKELLLDSIWTQESARGKKLYGEDGEIGHFQIMPDTAVEIAGMLNDEYFLRASPAAREQYLLQYDVGKRYAEAYLDHLLNEFDGDVEAALIGYNAGASRARRWLKHGRDDSQIPATTVTYYQKVLGRLTPDGLEYQQARRQGTRAGVRFIWSRGGKSEPMGLDHPELKALNKDLLDRASFAFAQVGMKELRINSGHRSKEHNAAVGGAKNSEHIGGNAIDISMSGLSHEKRLQLIKALSAAGVTGIGFGRNILHVDLGRRRAWSYNSSGKVVSKELAPEYAREALLAHTEGRIEQYASTTVSDPRLAGMDYEKRRKYLGVVDRELRRQAREGRANSAIARYEMEQVVDNNLASVLHTGQDIDGFDPEQVAAALGEKKYLKYQRDRATNARIHEETKDIITMEPAELIGYESEFEPVAGSTTFNEDLKVQSAVKREIARVERLRKKSPHEATLEIPEVRQAAEEVYDIASKGGDYSDAVQNYVKLSMAQQARWGIAPEDRAPLPRDQARRIGSSLADIPPMTAKNRRDIVEQIALRYDALKRLYGDHADEVMIQAVEVFGGLPEETADRIVAMMGSISAGRDPFRRGGRDDTPDNDIDEEQGFLGIMGDAVADTLRRTPMFWATGLFIDRITDDEEAPDRAADDILDDPDAMQSAVEWLTEDPSREGILRRQLGPAVVDELKKSMNVDTEEAN